MNLPQSKRTGTAAELAAMALFTDWGWAIGEDRDDVGYDLYVQPDIGRYKGQRFLAQVKGTRQEEKGRISAPVSKKRLREYLGNPHPVFIIRSTSERSLHWIHAQPWIEEHKDRLVGRGDLKVPLPKGQRLDDQEAFSRYLDEVMAPPEKLSNSLLALAVKRGLHLSSIDPRLQVDVGVQDGRTIYEITATQDGVSFPMHLTASNAGGAESLDKALRFGLPASINLAEMRVTGSPLFKELNLEQSSSVTIDLTPNSHQAVVTVKAGGANSLQSPSAQFPVNCFRGTGGWMMRTKEGVGVKLELEVSINPQRSALLKMGLDPDVFARQPLAQITHLAEFAAWADATLSSGKFLMASSEWEGQVAWEIPNDATHISSILRSISAVYKLQQMAVYFNSKIIIDPSSDMQMSDVRLVEFFHSVLDGSASGVIMPVLSVSLDHEPSAPSDDTYLTHFEHEITFGGKKFGSIDLELELHSYESSYNRDLKIFTLTAGEGSSALIKKKGPV